jgi:hypothetical protein
MTSTKTLGWIGGLAVLMAVATGCDEDAAGAACGEDLAVRVDAVVEASNRLSSSALGMQADVLAACEGIVVDLEGSVPPQDTDETNEEYVERVCALAAAAIDAELTAEVTVHVAVQPPQCTVDAHAQLECEAACDVTGQCDPGTVEARCEPGHLSVACEGTCDVNAYCEAYGDVEVQCEGTCEGVCTGDCSVATNEAGHCDGVCTGGCRGTCRVEAEGGIDCGAQARCRGGCTGDYSAPQCHVELEPPQCDIDADCQAGCTGQGSFNAQCTEGHIVVVIEGDVSENLASTLEANLPTILLVAEGMVDFFQGAAAFAEAAGRVSVAVANSTAGCIAAVTERLSTAVLAAGDAAISVSVSVEVSASVSGSAGM